MRKPIVFTLITILFFCACSGNNKKTDKNEPITNAIVSGVAWFDKDGNEVSAHGASIIKEGSKFYLFGEFHSDTSNAFNGFSCYSSTDLVNWNFERIVLPVQRTGLLGPQRVGERVKVMKCPSTGEFVMFMHCDNMQYRDPHIGYATSKKIDGEYKFHGPVLFNGDTIKKWDMGTFQDDDGTGYLLIHHGDIFKLSKDYRSVVEHVVTGVKNGESPTIFKHDSVYYWLTSQTTSWERNDNFYQTEDSLAGPWSDQKLIAPEGTLTWNSQCTYVLPIYGETDTTYMFMGDRWSFPRQNSAATYVWQPITIKNGQISIPEFNSMWAIDFQSGSWYVVDNNMDKVPDSKIKFEGEWNREKGRYRSNENGAVLSYEFTGKQVALEGIGDNTGGYARIEVTDTRGNVVGSTFVDFYCKYEEQSLKFRSPVLREGNYKISVEVWGQNWEFFDKKGNRFGSEDYNVTVTGIYTL